MTHAEGIIIVKTCLG